MKSQHVLWLVMATDERPSEPLNACKNHSMTLESPQRRATRKSRPSTTPPKAVRDNVLGRRPSKNDPLGEQPGTVGHSPDEQLPPASDERTRPSPAR